MNTATTKGRARGTAGKLAVGAAFAVTALALAFAVPAHAAPLSMPTDGPTSQPIGHYELCMVDPAECAAISRTPGAVRLTGGLWQELISVNNWANKTIQPRTDLDMWGKPEKWSYPDVFGDCEDYVLLKRKTLIGMGVPAGALLITVVRQKNGDGHAVLTVRTDRGDYILDNLENRILSWRETEYQFLKRQSARNSGLWEKVVDSRQVVVGSVRK
jgi:predicted transglutaminase-like cysteine proteinase